MHNNNNSNNSNNNINNILILIIIVTIIIIMIVNPQAELKAKLAGLALAVRFICLCVFSYIASCRASLLPLLVMNNGPTDQGAVLIFGFPGKER